MQDDPVLRLVGLVPFEGERSQYPLTALCM